MNMMNDKNNTGADERPRVALYIRVSTDEQARHGLSLDAQRETLQQYAKEKDMQVVGIYTDEGCSARKALARRKALKNLLHDVEQGKIDLILFIKLDRWFRNIADYYRVQDILDKHKVNWLAIQEDYNTLTTSGRLALNIRLSIAQNESDMTADRIKFVFENKKSRREALTGNLPLGYAIDNHKKIVQDENAHIIKDMFNHFIAHQNIMGTLRHLKEAYGIQWRSVSCRRALRNPAYIGTFYGIENYTEGIIDTDTFGRVQVMMKARRNTAPRKENGVFLFSGLIKCPSCGRVLGGSKGHKYPNQTEYKNKMYRCNRHGIEKECPFNRVIMENTLEKYLITNLKAQLQEWASTANNNTVPLAQVRKYKQDVKKYTENLARLKELYVNGFISFDEYNKDYQKYKTALDTAKALQPVNRKTVSKQVHDLMGQDIEGIYEKLSRENRKAFWHSIIEYIEVEKLDRGRGGEKIFRMVFL